ncbi:MAG: WG repeat-containing protein [Saprospiraceae bacterium]
MVKRLLVLGACWLAAVVLGAQTPIYPVRKDHKSGFIVLLGKNKVGNFKEVLPYYALIGDTYLPWNYFDPPQPPRLSPFLLFENDGKVGLIDQQLKEVLPNRYKRIRPLSPNCFAVETDSLFTAIDLSGRELIRGRFSDICPLLFEQGEPSYFLVQRNRRWGIYRRKPDSLLFEPRFAAVRLAHSDAYFKVKLTEDQQLWGLADRSGQLVLPCLYTDIIVFHRNFIAVELPGNGWRIINKNEKQPEILAAVTPLTRHWAAVSPKRKSDVLWNLDTQTPVARLPDSIAYQYFWPFDDQHIIGKLPNGWQGLLDSTLRTIVPPKYDSLLASGEPNIFFVKQRGKWGVIALTDSVRLIHPGTFISVQPFSEGLAWVKTETGIGALNRAGVEIEPPLYETLLRTAPNFLKGKMPGGDLVMIELGQQNGIVVKMTASALVDPITIPRNVRQWVLNDPVTDGIVEEIQDYEALDSFQLGLLVFRPALEFPAALLQKTGLAASTADTMISRFSERIFAVTAPGKTVRLDYIRPFYTQELQVFTLYRADGERVAQAPALVGYRPFQGHAAYTTFIDAQGRMGLINRAGQELHNERGEPIRYAYIGPFRSNRARVCLDGELVAAESTGDYDSRKLAEPEEFADQFQLMIPTQRRGQRIKPNQIFYVRSVEGKEAAPQWSFMDGKGRLVPGNSYDFVHSFQESDSLALVAHFRAPDQVHKPELEYGAVDTALHPVIPMQYSRITRIENNFRVEVKSAANAFNLYYFNPQGKQLCTLKKVPKGFSEGLCGLRGPDDRWGFIDTNGVTQIDYRYKAIERFSEGLAAVFDGERWSFIDPQGSTVFTPSLGIKNKIGEFHGGRCHFVRQEKWGYYDRSGQEVIGPKYSWASNFSYGAAAVKVKDAQGKIVAAVIDSAGHFLLAPSGDFLDIKPFDAFGKALARRKDNSWVVLDHLGKVVSAAYTEIKPFVGGFANVRRGSLWGSIGLEGKPRLALSYASVGLASEGLVAVQPGSSGKWVFVDTLGRPSTVRGAFPQAGRFKEGAAMLGNQQLINLKGDKLLEKERVLFFSEGLYGIRERKGMAFFADGEGNDFFKAQYDSITPFRHGIAKVRLAKKKIWGIIDQHGLYVLYPKYGHIGDQPDGNFVVNPQRYYGLVDRKGRTLLETKYDRIKLVLCDNCQWSFSGGGAVYRVESGEEVGYFALGLPVEKRWIWAIQK